MNTSPPSEKQIEHRKRFAAAGVRAAQERAKARTAGEPLPPPKPRFADLVPPPGQKWMIDEVIAAYLSNEDAVCSIEIVDALVEKARYGDVQAATFLAERAHGKPLQKLQVDARGVITLSLLDSLLPEAPRQGA